MELINKDKLDDYKFKSASERMDLSVDYMSGWNEAIDHIEANAPKVEAKPVRHGFWEFGENEYGDDGYYCSACHGHVVWKYDTESIDFIKEYNYCPFCCAKMGERYF